MRRRESERKKLREEGGERVTGDLHIAPARAQAQAHFHMVRVKREENDQSKNREAAKKNPNSLLHSSYFLLH